MDAQTIFAYGGASATITAVSMFIFRNWKHIVGHVLVSKCCDKKFEMGIDVRDMTPEAKPTAVAPTAPGTALEIRAP
jgi:hypothetical protein